MKKNILFIMILLTSFLIITGCGKQEEKENKGDKEEIDVAYTIGKSFGTYVLNMGKKTCVVGQDNRYSSPELASNLIEGLLSTGINVIDLGLVTTPMYYYACIKLNKDELIPVFEQKFIEEFKYVKCADLIRNGRICNDNIGISARILSELIDNDKNN